MVKNHLKYSSIWIRIRMFTKQHLANLKIELSNLSPSCKTWRHLVTSATEGEGGYVFTPLCLLACLSVCLFICLCAGYLKKLWTDLDEIWWAS